MAKIVELDGRTLEGGGQLLRIAICLSALTSIPVRIHDIRGNRSGGGGLKAQHLACVNWLAQACQARVEGAEKGSKTLLFEPGQAKTTVKSQDECPGFKKKTSNGGQQVWETRVDIGTAGSTGLALQAILPFILFSKRPSELPLRLSLSGGTNVSGSPSYEYITKILLPTLHAIGFPEMKATLGKRGWSHGGTSIGNFTLEIPPRTDLALPAFRLKPDEARHTPAEPAKIEAMFIAPALCHQHFLSTLAEAMKARFGDDCEVEMTCEDSKHDKRLYLIVAATMSAEKSGTYRLGRDWLYDRKLPKPLNIRTYEKATNDMISEVLKDLRKECQSGSFVDEHLRDQLVIFQALAEGRSQVHAPGEPSLHARTAEWVAREMLGVRFDGENRCEGFGFGGARRAVEELAQKLDDLGLDDGARS